MSQTPYLDDDSGAERTDAQLLIYSGDLDPSEVTALLGVQPTSYVRKGEVIKSALGRERNGTLNGWFLSSESEVHSLDIRRHLDWLLRMLRNEEGLQRLQDTSGVTMRVNCVWWAKGSGGPILSPEQMRQLADLNLECHFDLSFYGDEEDDVASALEE